MKIGVSGGGHRRTQQGTGEMLGMSTMEGVLSWHDLQSLEGRDSVPSLVPPCTGWQKVVSEPNSVTGPNSLMPCCFSELLGVIGK